MLEGDKYLNADGCNFHQLNWLLQLFLLFFHCVFQYFWDYLFDLR